MTEHKDPWATPFPRRAVYPHAIDSTASRSRELVDLGRRDFGEGDLLLTEEEVNFQTFKGREWRIPYTEIEHFKIRRGALGYVIPSFRIIVFHSRAKRFHATLGAAAATNAAHILDAKGVKGRWARWARSRVIRSVL